MSGHASPVEEAFEAARSIADTVLYEGYLLYPYRASAQKNRLRWQFGVLAPREWSEADGADPWRNRTETLLEAGDDAVVHLRLRCLQLQTFAAGDDRGWDEGVERRIDAAVPLSGALAGGKTITFRFPGDATGTRRLREVSGSVDVSARRQPGPYGVVRLRVDVENTTGWGGAGCSREEALRRSMVATHLLLGAEGGTFLSLADPPQWARPFAEGCVNERTWPVLLGGDGRPTVVLSSPIILPDHAEVAGESPGDLFDATEIDEILSLRTLALTEDEKREARATDPRAGAIVDRLESMPPEVWERLHGAIRSLRPVRSSSPWWDPGADPTVSPGTDSVTVAGVALRRGHRVLLRPGRADAQDMFLAGRTGVVEAVLSDVEGGQHLAVTLEDDPGADLLQAHGRYLYFHPEEVEPL